MNVGIRELKAKLSEYLSRAAAGEDIVVTDRGRPIVRLVPFSQDDMLQRGFEEGWIEAPRREGLTATERFRSSSAVLDVLDEDRG
jgi:prevent-host-death family protein